MTTFIRGTTIVFTAVCTDADGVPVTPSTATLHIVFVALSTGIRTHLDITMDITGSSMTAKWDSSVAADTLPVTWSIRTTGADAVAQDGNFTLTANESNP